VQRVRRSVVLGIGVLLVVAVAVGAGGQFLQEQLRPCAPLDLALRRSGCVRVIEVPQLDRVPYISAAPDGGRAAVTAISVDERLMTVLVVDLQSGSVLEEYLISDVESQEREPLPYAIYAPDGRLTRDYQSRKQITLVLSQDGEKLISFIERRPCLFVAVVEGETTAREIPVSGGVPRLAQLALSYDDSRLALADGRFLAWDLETGALLLDLYDEAFSDADWLPDNRTLIVGLSGHPVRIGFFELPEAATAPQSAAAPQCQPETDEVRRWWVE
jgi:hypothetical protein